MSSLQGPHTGFYRVVETPRGKRALPERSNPGRCRLVLVSSTTASRHRVTKKVYAHYARIELEVLIMVTKAAIFDLDGLLIDSEPLWQEAEIKVFRSVGVPLTRDLARETVGVRLDAVVRHWHDRFPWRGESIDVVETRILEEVTRLIIERGEAMPGVRETIDTLRAENFELAVASSSPMQLIRAALETFGLLEAFSVLHSAETEAEGKPHPAVYVSTMSRLGVGPGHCIAFEDTVIGVRAAKAAGARVIAVPDPADIADPAFADADVVLSSLTEFSLALVP